MKRTDPSDVTATLLAMSPERRLTLMKAAWPAAVGPDLARRSEVVALDGEVLRIRVPDGTWRKNLWAMRKDLLARLRRIGGKAAPRGLGFVEGRVQAAENERSREEPAPTPVVAPLPRDLEDAAAQIPDEEARQRFRDAVGRYLGRFGGEK